MKRIDLSAYALALLLMFSLFSLSCKKSAGGPYNMILMVNGASVTLYDATCKLGPVIGSPGVNQFKMTAATYDSSKALIVLITLTNENLKTGSYASDASNPAVQVNYYEDISTPGQKNFTIANASGKPACKYTVNIVEVAGNIIRGNIAGNYLTNVAGGNATIDIPNGDFYALRIY